jgi:hypothetical protein
LHLYDGQYMPIILWCVNWERGLKWLNHNYEMNCVRNEDVDNLVWSRYIGNSAEFLVKKNLHQIKNNTYI